MSRTSPETLCRQIIDIHAFAAGMPPARASAYLQAQYMAMLKRQIFEAHGDQAARAFADAADHEASPAGITAAWAAKAQDAQRHRVEQGAGFGGRS